MTDIKSIVVIVPYFGKWPEWFPLFLESCRCNETIHWLFFTDCKIPVNTPENTRFISISFSQYKELISSALNIDFNPEHAYKLCDIKPALGKIHEKDISSYDLYGYSDIDLIYGNIRKFYDNIVLSHNCISTHWDRLSGHFCLFKNSAMMRDAFSRIPNWERLMMDQIHHGLDESKFSKVFLRHKKYPAWARYIYSLTSPYQRNNYFREQYTTILSPKKWWNGEWEHPETWFWEKGRLTNNKDEDREFLYFHFMNYKSSTWLDPMRGTKAAWDGLKKLNYVPQGKESQGFVIDRTGFHSLMNDVRSLNQRS